MTPTPTPGAAAELPVVYVGKIAEGQTLFMPRESVNKLGMIALTPHTPAQSQLDALREEVARLTRERDRWKSSRDFYRGEWSRKRAELRRMSNEVDSMSAELTALKAQPSDVDALMALADEFAAAAVRTASITNDRSDVGTHAVDTAREALRAKLVARKELT
jgi:chromosome segregation ATPase